jgi:calcineurin-like phosphoesterase family protein
MDYFISDTHFYHHNVIQYSNRPFANALEMNDALICNWNAVVKPDDRVFHLGDVGFCSVVKLHEILDRLNGRIHLIKGNHDHKTVGKDAALQRRFVWVKDYHEESIDGQFVVMAHYPILEWNRAHRGSLMLHGHCHGSRDADNVALRRLDVGVDSFCKNGYSPRSFKEVAAELLPKPMQTHHGRNEDAQP